MVFSRPPARRPPAGSGAGGKRRSKRQSQPRGETAPPPPANKLDLGFFDRLLTPKGERAFVEGCKAYIEGKPQKAISELQTATHLADGAFLAGFLTVGEHRYAAAEKTLKKALARQATLGRYFDKYGLSIELGLPITKNLVAYIRPCRRGGQPPLPAHCRLFAHTAIGRRPDSRAS